MFVWVRCSQNWGRNQSIFQALESIFTLWGPQDLAGKILSGHISQGFCQRAYLIGCHRAPGRVGAHVPAGARVPPSMGTGVGMPAGRGGRGGARARTRIRVSARSPMGAAMRLPGGAGVRAAVRGRARARMGVRAPVHNGARTNAAFAANQPI